MTGNPFTEETTRMQNDRPIRLVAVGVTFAAVLPLFFSTTLLLLVALLPILDAAGHMVERRLLERPDRNTYRLLCAVCFLFCSVFAILAVILMMSGGLIAFFVGQMLLWMGIGHCIVIRSERVMMAAACYTPMVAAFLVTPGILSHLGASRIEVIAGAVPILTSCGYLATLIRASIQQKIELGQARQTAFDALRTREQFFASIGHEIRTPLNGILGVSQILESGAVTRTDRERARVLKSSCQNLNVLISDMLDHAKLSEGKFTIQPTPTVTTELIASVEGLYRDAAQQQGIALRTEYVGRNPPCILVDPVRLRQILCNLVSNALKYTQQGEIVIRVATFHRRETPWLSIIVSDTGTGIARDQLPKIFEPYLQLDDDLSRAGIGTGLGLVIARDLARYMGGDVTVESQLGIGTKFTIDLPSPLAEEIVEDKAEADIPDLGGRTVLIADDTRTNRMILRKFLDGTNATIVDAEDGRSALDIVASRHVDLLLIDMHMPRLDGQRTVMAIRDDPDEAHIRTILMSASHEADADLFDGVVSKPVDRGNLLKLIVRLLADDRANDMEGAAKISA